MAKLEGVKTLDMVNGEITKVAYDGAEYERVEGEAKVGDLVLITTNGWTDAREGEFYKAVGVDSGGDAKIKDDRGTIDSHFRYNYDLFRKVSASTGPSLEERVSSAEGEIESLKSDVAALKGESEYKRIAKSEARAGDYVKFDDPPSYLTDKEYYEIKEFDDRDPVIIDDDGDEYHTYSDKFEVYRKVSAASVEVETKPERLKVGDYARVVENLRVHCAEIGEIVLVKIDDESVVPYKCEKLNGERGGWFYESELVRATDEEVAEAKDAAARAKFKEGAKVRLKSGGGDYPLGGFTDGNIYEVSANAYNHRRGTLIRIEGGDCFRGSGFAAPDQLEILSEEEVAEIERKQAEEAKWAKIGRKVGEYKKGDVVQFKDDYVAIGVVEDVGTSRLGVRMPDEAYQGPYKNDVTLITPVEARFDR
ncbi:hypothetical protein BSF20_19340 [Bacillus amyloliquefaciens]|uniref:hypothetical protein n=1 Tax=Bacillus amyloliquefaciens TaxID=1390 RepID=UPI000909E46B|nr:hypothetical protein [Bacillus amyloliquefaciens]APH46896.1 hypothetical protein BSF20_00020 [Bacillus amyloliquefaciens]APH50449.1 hypothetical protein BSF20_19340 [Bacillus amyloliquefaciens]